MPDPLVVVDTSVHLASELYAKADSPSREVIRRGFANHFVFAMSPQLGLEITRKMVEKGISIELTAKYLANVIACAREFDDVEDDTVTCTDPEDLFVKVLAKTASSWCIVSYDKSLLDDAGTPPGWTPPPFLGRLRDRRSEAPNTRLPTTDAP